MHTSVLSTHTHTDTHTLTHTHTHGHHQVTVDKCLAWIDADGSAASEY
jgi:hypothetical protein